MTPDSQRNTYLIGDLDQNSFKPAIWSSAQSLACQHNQNRPDLTWPDLT